MIKVIVAGSRDFQDYEFLKSKLDYLLSNFLKHEITIISGGARGADKLGEKYAKEKGLELVVMAADWNLGKSAGYIRNEQMSAVATHCVCFNLDQSKGTGHMINIAKAKGLHLRVYNFITK